MATRSPKKKASAPGSDPGSPDVVETETLRFEEALARLEELVDSLESGKLDLEDSLLNFEEGVKLVRLCKQRIEAAELRIRQLEEGPEGPTEVESQLASEA